MTLRVMEHAVEVANAAPLNFNQRWLRTLESLIPDILKDPANTYRTVDPMLAQRYEGDFYGLLIAMGISAKSHWIIMRINGLNSPTEFDGQGFNLLYPNSEYIQENLTLFNTIYRNTL